MIDVNIKGIMRGYMAGADHNKINPEIIRSLELALEEQRRDYDIVHSLHEAIKIKNVTFLAAALGLLGYLYTGTNGKLKEKLFIPNQSYGVIFYVTGVFLLLGAIGGFMVVLIKNRAWHTAYDNDQEEDMLNDYEKYLRYMRKRYLKVSKINVDCYEKRRYLLNNAFMAMILGVTILLLLKTFGG